MIYTQEILINKLKSRFEKYGIEFNNMCEILIKYNAFISGSFLLQTILNEEYKDGDIDIYVPGSTNEKLEHEISELSKTIIFNKITSGELSIVKKNFYYVNDEDTVSFNRLQNVTYEHKIIETNKLKNWNTESSKDKCYITICDFGSQKYIDNKYKNIIFNKKHSIEIAPDYGFDKINTIVNFESNNVFSKYQLIYYDDENIKTPKDMINNHDFDFCKNYFDGKEFYVDNIESILSKSCILNLTKLRIYNNKNKRIIKYIKRGFDIKINCNDIEYNVLYVSKENIIDYNTIDEKNINLIVILEHCNININKIISILPFNLQHLVIYSYPKDTILDNLPLNLNEIRLYIWKQCCGMEEPNSTHKYFFDDKENAKHILDAKKNIKKIPYGCKIYINDIVI